MSDERQTRLPQRALIGRESKLLKDQDITQNSI